MLKNYLLTAIRNIIKNKLFSFINISGLTLGMAIFLFIMHYVDFERSYDTFHRKSDRIYRLRYERTDKSGEAVRFASCCPPAGLRIRANLPEVEKVARIFRSTGTVQYGEKLFYEEKIFFAENEIFSIFDIKFIAGSPETGISEPNKAFISKSIAKKYFGDTNPMEKMFSIDKKTVYEVAGVFEDLPANSHVKIDFLLSYKTLIAKFGEEVEESWGDSGWYTYLLFKRNADIAGFNRRLKNIIDKEVNEEWKNYNLRMDLILQPLLSIHLDSDFQQEFEENGDKDSIDFLAIIAILVIIIAWVNYVNLSTVHSLTRAKEVGLRKVVGASRLQLIMQFFVETILINIAALIFTYILILVLTPEFNSLTGISSEFSIWTSEKTVTYSLILFVAGILLSGFYPIIKLTSFKPVEVLKGKLGISHYRKLSFRKVLVIFQFVMSIGLMTFTFAVMEQLEFMKGRETGFDGENVLVIRSPRVRDASFGSKIKTFENELITNSIAEKFCFATEVPGRQILWDAGGIFRVGSDENKNYQIVGIDENYAGLFNLKFAAGRNFSSSFRSDSLGLILNETAVHSFGFKSNEDAIGKQISYWGVIFHVVGVLKDFHQQSVKKDFEPHIFRYLPTGRDIRGCLVLKINPNWNIAEIGKLERLYQNFYPGNAFEYFFLDEYYNLQYESDELFGRVFTLFSFLAIFVTCLGVLGLSSYMIMQKTKEIGIRKVLGAGMMDITLLMVKDFVILILAAFIICIPLSYSLISIWLESFAVRMDISADIFLIPLLLVFVITVCTICLYIIKAIRTNPVNSLRYE